MSPRQHKALLELNRHLGHHPNTPLLKELSENIDVILKTGNGGRAYKLIGDWKNQGEEYLIQHANQY